MRFFRPALQSKSYAAAALCFPIVGTSISSVYITPDLTNMTVQCHSAAYKKSIDRALRSGLTHIPTATRCQWDVNQHQFQLFDLFDVMTRLSQITMQIKQQDPNFLFELEQLAELDDLEKNEQRYALMQLLTINPARAEYFCLQGLRQEGVQHVVELPLKALQQHHYMTQVELNKMIQTLWPCVSRLREQHAHTPAPEEKPWVPYVFR